MIQADGASRLPPAADGKLRPALPQPDVTDKLAGFVAGQRLLAEIQSLLPNGHYRALINQRSFTLALPFAARAGDAIELEVAESDGKLTLALAARAAADSAKMGSEASATRLSRTGQLIGTLLGEARAAGGGAQALPLNGQQPISAAPPQSAQDLLPLLAQAIRQSGMFYESHQAEWVEGRYSKAELLQEPQARLTTEPAARQPSPAAAETDSSAAVATLPPVRAATSKLGAAESTSAQQAIAPPLQGLVQQQLEAFATQNFAWQGQAWPGQQIDWEIENSSQRGDPGSADDGRKWLTRLRLTLPRLGSVDARLHLEGKQIAVSIAADNAETGTLLRSAGARLQRQLEQAGLELASLGVIAAAPAGDAQPAPDD